MFRNRAAKEYPELGLTFTCQEVAGRDERPIPDLRVTGYGLGGWLWNYTT
jgi:hypothetical protein